MTERHLIDVTNGWQKQKVFVEVELNTALKCLWLFPAAWRPLCTGISKHQRTKKCPLGLQRPPNAGRMGPTWRELQATAMPISSLYHPFRQPRVITRGQEGRHRPHCSIRRWPRSYFQKSTSDGSYCRHYLWKIQSATDALPGLVVVWTYRWAHPRRVVAIRLITYSLRL